MSLRHWKLPEHLNVYKIALLSGGYNPSDHEDTPEDWPQEIVEATSVYVSSTMTAERT